ncbi:MAG: LpqB family beta-propeller domain-containing protein, partial [Fidelibacterota bacterium]
MMRRKSLLIGSVLLILMLFSISPAQQAATITPEIVVSLKTVSHVEIDPSGKNIVYVLSIPRTPDDKPGGRYSEIWVVTRKGEQRRYTMSKINSWSPSWSPDGKKIAFLSARGEDKKTQVYLIPVDGGAPEQVTDSKTSVSMYRWSGDGKYIAYTASDPKSEGEKKDEKEGRDWKVIDEKFKHRRLWAVEVESGETHKITTTDISIWDFAWSPDGKKLVIAASLTPRVDDSYMFKKLYLVDSEGGEPAPLCETGGKLGMIRWSPDGKRIAFLAGVDSSDPSAGSIFVVSSEGGNPVNITGGFEATVTWIDWVNRRTLSFVAIEGTETILNYIPAAGGKISRILRGGPVFTAVSFSGDKKSLAFSGSTPEHPSEVFFSKVKGKPVRLTRNNPQLEDISLASQEVIRWKTSDGLEMEGILMKPLNYEPGKRYPLIVQIHGGPEAAYLNGWNTYYIRWTQLLA